MANDISTKTQIVGRAPLTALGYTPVLGGSSYVDRFSELKQLPFTIALGTTAEMTAITEPVAGYQCFIATGSLAGSFVWTEGDYSALVVSDPDDYLASDTVASTVGAWLRVLVTEKQIGDSAVTASKIGSGAVTTAKIADSAVTTEKINDAAVTTAKLADSAVTTAKINNLAVTNAKIADGTITASKLAFSTLVGWAEFNNGSDPATAPTAAGANSLATGNASTAAGGNSLASGSGTTASGDDAAAVGPDATAAANYTVAVGSQAYAYGNEAVAIGYIASTGASGNIRSTAVGPLASISGTSSSYAVAVGYSATVGAASSVAIGDGPFASAANCVAIGSNVSLGGFTPDTYVAAVGARLTANSKDRLSYEHKLTLRTTDDTATTVAHQLVDGVMYAFRTTVIAKDAGGAGFFHQVFEGLVECTSGTASILGTTTSTTAIATGTISTATASMTASANDLAPQLTGVAATTVDWSVFTEFKAAEQ